eukprot:COSAG03_NODE_29190_length_189_cov_11.411111_1_plen_27_part_01
MAGVGTLALLQRLRLLPVCPALCALIA